MCFAAPFWRALIFPFLEPFRLRFTASFNSLFYFCALISVCFQWPPNLNQLPKKPNPLKVFCAFVTFWRFICFFCHLGKVKRAPSAYNIFMKTECVNIKKLNPTMSAKDIFKRAAESWKNAPANPKNGGKKPKSQSERDL